jgi:sigma-B regulation protein RsbU (phosphoserine phosphatase)
MLRRTRPRALLPGHAASRALRARQWLTRTFAGRALLIGAAIKLATGVAGTRGRPLPAFLEALDLAGGVILLVGVGIVISRLFVAAKRRLLWRVRRKLTLSYIFIGVVPALLIIMFFVLCGLLLFFNVSSYLMQSRIRGLVDQAQFLAQTAALELQRAGSSAAIEDIIQRRQAGAATRSPDVSYSVVPVHRSCVASSTSDHGPRSVAPLAVGPWRHLEPPRTLPDWVPCSGYASLIAYDETMPDGSRGPTRVALRAVAVPDVESPAYAVIVDVPVASAVKHQLRDDTGIELGDIAALNTSDAALRPLEGRPIEQTEGPDAPAPGSGQERRGRLQQRLPYVAFLDYTDWNTGRRGTLAAAIGTSIAEIYERISSTPIARIGTFSFGQILLLLVAVVGGLFLVIQFVAFAMGFALARSITGSVHELFKGTERVQQRDFTHRIPIRSHDQLGELARSFNEMTASIRDLLHEKEEKDRLEQELKIARSIQMSLLPQGPLLMPGLALTAHCEPAREVGGDYYDFLPLDEHRLGILIADVSGKGTSAALYMAELKGLVLSLSQLHTSPRQLLIDANRILSNHLDSRSFITMTYAVADMRARTLTYARAGHCPLIYLPGPYAHSRGVKILAPDGLVLGLKIDNGEMFSRLLKEETLPLGPGDLFMLFTDGISEAMSPTDEYFGVGRLGGLIEEHRHLPLEELRERILREVRAFVGGASQQDDMTMLLLKVEEFGVSADL